MNSKKTFSFLFVAGIILYIAAFVLNIVFDIIAKNDVLARITDKLVWILFGFVLGIYFYRKRGDGDGNRK